MSIDWGEAVPAGAQVVAAVASAVAAMAALYTVRKLDQARRDDAREKLLDAVQAGLAELRHAVQEYGLVDGKFWGSRVSAVQRPLRMQYLRLSDADRAATPVTLEVAEGDPFEPTRVDDAIEQFIAHRAGSSSST